ncbi:MAG TPA: RluA family pseudouridine synthase [Kofleriaceae bacterium]|nr:RluA family pseudouridine synthase [Kofleriaceae bacterium]
MTPSDVDDEPITSVDDDDQDDAPFASHHITIAAAGRLDAAVAAQIDGLSRAQVQRLIDGGHVRVAGMVATKANQRVREHDVVDIDVPPPEPLELVAEPIPLSILFEDADIIVIDKPAGLVVHPAPGHTRGTLVNALLYHCTSLAGIGGVLRPGIVHRLDRDTTGVMVATKSDRAHAAISAAFAAKSRGEPGGIVREYLAIVAPPPPPSGTLRTLYGRHPVDRKKFSSKVATGKPAVTHWTTERTLATGAAALIRLRLETGRTHQIRVHMADHGWPLVGDPVYGGKGRFPDVAATLGRQALHAATLELDHPTTGARMRFESPLPADLQIAETALTIR